MSDLINEMIFVSMRFRGDKFACVSDIVKGYLIIKLQNSDTDSSAGSFGQAILLILIVIVMFTVQSILIKCQP